MNPLDEESRVHLTEALRAVRLARRNLSKAVEEASRAGANCREFIGAQASLTRAEGALHERDGELRRRREGKVS